jgi:Malic enzyme, N-terminal domain
MLTDGLTGSALLRDARYNKGTAFTSKERIDLKLEGLLPPHISTQDEQVLRCFTELDDCHTDLERYVYMQDLAYRNRTLFFRVMQDRLVELLPIVYTPTVGQAVRVILSPVPATRSEYFRIFGNRSANRQSHENYGTVLFSNTLFARFSAKSLDIFFGNRRVSICQSNKRAAFDKLWTIGNMTSAALLSQTANAS